MGVVTESFPDISFIDDTTIDEVLTQMIKDFQEKYKEVTGKEVVLASANPYRLIMYACAMQIYQAMQYADYAGKMGFLKYANGEYLDNLAALHGVRRKKAEAATTILRFSTDKEMESAVGIPAGTRVTNGNEIYFATNEYAEIGAGCISAEVSATCTENGKKGNGLEAGELQILVNILPYISAVSNIEKTGGGTDEEDDDNLKERIYFSTGSHSVAGPEAAYAYWTKSVSPLIRDVSVVSPSPGEVHVYFICEGGELPDDILLEKVKAVTANDNIRPLTDRVSVLAPDTADYNIEFTYYIAGSDKSSAVKIQENVHTAVRLYQEWQSEKIGRDINPSCLVQKIMAAGAKRVIVKTPEFAAVSTTSIARCRGVSIVYGGLEDD